LFDEKMTPSIGDQIFSINTNKKGKPFIRASLFFHLRLKKPEMNDQLNQKA